jgi:hypothetical protein
MTYKCRYRTLVSVVLSGSVRHTLFMAETRSDAVREVRDAANELLLGHTGTASFCAAFNAALNGLAENGPLAEGLEMEVFWAVEAWEPPGPSRIEATDRLRVLARRIEVELVE